MKSFALVDGDIRSSFYSLVGEAGIDIILAKDFLRFLSRNADD